MGFEYLLEVGEKNRHIAGSLAVSDPVEVIDKISAFARSFDERKPLPSELVEIV